MQGVRFQRTREGFASFDMIGSSISGHVAVERMSAGVVWRDEAVILDEVLPDGRRVAADAPAPLQPVHDTVHQALALGPRPGRDGRRGSVDAFAEMAASGEEPVATAGGGLFWVSTEASGQRELSPLPQNTLSTFDIKSQFDGLKPGPKCHQTVPEPFPNPLQGG
jgi:hypothetical protein